MCSHTIKDLLSLPDEHERMKALGLIERSGMLICGALPPEEMPRLAQTKDFSDRRAAPADLLAGPARLEYAPSKTTRRPAAGTS